MHFFRTTVVDFITIKLGILPQPWYKIYYNCYVLILQKQVQIVHSCVAQLYRK